MTSWCNNTVLTFVVWWHKQTHHAASHIKWSTYNHVQYMMIINDYVVVLCIYYTVFFIITSFLKRLLFYLFWEKGEGEKHQCERETDWLPLLWAPTGDQICNPGMCPDRESNSDLPLCSVMPNQLSHTSQGFTITLECTLSTYIKKSPHVMKTAASHISCLLYPLIASFSLVPGSVLCCFIQ